MNHIIIIEILKRGRSGRFTGLDPGYVATPSSLTSENWTLKRYLDVFDFRLLCLFTRPTHNIRKKVSVFVSQSHKKITC